MVIQPIGAVKLLPGLDSRVMRRELLEIDTGKPLRGIAEFKYLSKPFEPSCDCQKKPQSTSRKLPAHPRSELQNNEIKISSAAHDLNNQLMIISGSIELIAAGEDCRDETVEAILNAVDQSKKLTRRLLAPTDKIEATAKTLNLTDLIPELAERFRLIVDQRTEIEWESEAELWSIRVDESQLVDALLNLVVNAQDAMSSGGKLSFVSRNVVMRGASALLPKYIEPGAFVQLDVVDHGDGIDGTDIAKIFDPYFTTKPFGEGIGLGLFSVAKFVEASGGFVRANSQVGTGTTISLYLPRTN
ncbi:ATP-binding protein [uncultured Erythrobacter sp.]|uniref:ATP-binding protein n=1 Tax=uncultured Erythrobacter sp. TaxID=263913 RepID=UPI00262F33BA|nr:ATP-binding protein [uncultured Erythrobacter sp.]